MIFSHTHISGKLDQTCTRWDCFSNWCQAAETTTIAIAEAAQTEVDEPDEPGEPLTFRVSTSGPVV